ncbi:Poly(3-hydroxyalkanoate) synthetase [Hahella chejuensis KCTC 2396]|uniref:Poly(3-hydroxyalkanoate) synthetase n=1 Tax=Hahella chejuensis (strain KCTC 2396) TaxID=349521 RepID=Q2SPI5_HAHCH|nr:alpha/beta fold hydrolase [Hahella chejuensis]ABC27439.1 Poly(3-hydroxyalkanoate) synthetase [Hahella chejuensis KCTC 2396]
MDDSSLFAESKAIDRLLHAFIGYGTGGNSPAAFIQAYTDWVSHAVMAPGKHAELAKNISRNLLRYGVYCSRTITNQNPEPVIAPLPQDIRFRNEEWGRFPFNLAYQWFLLYEQWWHYATTDIPGVSPRNENIVSFCARQILDLMSPSNIPWLNPEVIKKTLETGGKNFLDGLENWREDAQRMLNGDPPVGSENYKVGENLAVTPGKVIYRNRLIELIQYAPTTERTYKEPVLIVPAWIMKYYILDLSPHNSLARYLVEQGHTVFMISWLNPDSKDRNLGMQDYLRLGVTEALDAISAIVPDAPAIHGVGYCLGGTLLSIAAAAMARNEDKRLATISLFAAQTDFKEAGELMLFINESQLTFLEDLMWEQGYLDATQMSGAFMMLRSKDLLWSRIVREYMLGERSSMNDLMAWNADTTRMPYRMHSQYLRSLFLNNDLAEGRFEVDDSPIFLRDIRIPIFAVGATKDHVAPWKSVYKIRRLTSSAEITFLLTSGGHNAGIISEPGHPRRSYQINTRYGQDRNYSPDDWLNIAPRHEGSWWPAWSQWLRDHSSAEQSSPPPLGAPDSGYPQLCDAPGTYIYQR